MNLAPENLRSLITTAEAATLAGVSAATIRVWVNRGQLQSAGKDPRGRPVYRLIDVARAELATRATGVRPRRFAAA